MSDLQITAWKRNGHDRLYVNLPNGEAVAWLNRKTGQVTVLREEYRAAAMEALTGYLPPTAAADPAAPSASYATPPPLPPLTVEEDLASNRPGAALRAKLAAEGPGPVKRASDWLLQRNSEWDSWRKGLAGERRVGAELQRLAGQGWHVLHSVPLPRDVDVDHLLIGPGGVFSVNTKHHHGKTVWVGDDSVKVDNGRPQPYARKSRAEAKRVRRVLERHCGFEVPVEPVIVFVGVSDLEKVVTLLDVRVYREREVAALGPTTGVLSLRQVEQVYEIARHRQIWANA
ncbi:nuclease-related domain-containing protein [Streptomyces sp. H27-D2]|uniref:nuclease-related domain-containing protein n=1 Tax=Streptomyces sp. H27-D2 TaxID=3046304 RepID=UPI002DB86001|nr:nuclease-related domain-containing protein [Streptomyces sp. H27-D2]MEC4016203.1 nuclease-related domain-containing protein [Streptomyces sp. H27-D2]